MHESGRIGLRWRTEKEVIAGRGQFSCASKHCESNDNLHSYEVPFEYNEQGTTKNELVKVRVCINCARKLYYEKLKTMRRERRKKRRLSRDGGDSDSDAPINSHDEILQELFNFQSNAECKDGEGEGGGKYERGRRHGRSP